MWSIKIKAKDETMINEVNVDIVSIGQWTEISRWERGEGILKQWWHFGGNGVEALKV